MIDETWYQRPTNPLIRISAGGVVVRRDQDNQVLIALAREGNWPDYVLPKGGVEKGEDLEQTARREIAEEAGLTDLQLIRKLAVLERLSYEKKYWIVTHYFLFTTTQVLGVPSDSAHHFGIWWFPIDELPQMFWPDQKELISANNMLIQTLFE
ncbi:MAG: NUDIX hydrolase [Chloroflexota bacterium]